MNGVTIESVDALDCRFAPGLWDFAREQSKAIEAHWLAFTQGNRHVFNGRVLVLREGATHIGPDGRRVFRGVFIEVEYKALLYWQRHGHGDTKVRNVFAMAGLQASDGAFVLGEMGGHTANPGRIYFPAGTPDLNDVSGDSVDLDGSVWRELAEETGLTEADVAATPGWTLVTDGPRIACMKRLTAHLPARILTAKIHATHAQERARGETPELARMHVWRRPGDIANECMPLFMRDYLEAFQPG